MICKYLLYFCFELCRWLLWYVGEFGHKDSQNASFLVTVITKSLKHHEIISGLRPNEFLSFCLGISSRPVFTCYFLCGFILCAFHWEYAEVALIFEWIQGILEVHLVLLVCILIFSLCFESSTLEWNFCLSSFCLSLSVSLSVSLGWTQSTKLGKGSVRTALSPAVIWWRFYPFLFVHTFTQSKVHLQLWINSPAGSPFEWKQISDDNKLLFLCGLSHSRMNHFDKSRDLHIWITPVS